MSHDHESAVPPEFVPDRFTVNGAKPDNASKLIVTLGETIEGVGVISGVADGVGVPSGVADGVGRGVAVGVIADIVGVGVGPEIQGGVQPLAAINALIDTRVVYSSEKF